MGSIILAPPIAQIGASVPGLEGLHTWNREITMGDEGGWPHVRLQRLENFHSLPPADSTPEPSVGRIGDVLREYIERGKPVTYSGVLRGRSLVQLRQLEFAINAAFAERDGRMEVAEHPAYGHRTFFFDARVNSCDIPDEQTARPTRVTGGYERPLTLTLHMADPRFYSSLLLSAQTSPLTFDAGITLPFTAPVQIPAPGSASGVVSVNNPGSAPTDFIGDLYGPVTNPFLSNDTIQAVLALRDLVLPAGQFVRVLFRERQLWLNGTERLHGKVDWDRTTWWDAGVVGLPRGDSSIRYRGDEIADPARAELSWYAAQWN